MISGVMYSRDVTGTVSSCRFRISRKPGGSAIYSSPESKVAVARFSIAESLSFLLNFASARVIKSAAAPATSDLCSHVCTAVTSSEYVVKDMYFLHNEPGLVFCYRYRQTN